MDNKVKIIDIFGQFHDKGSGHYYTYPAMAQEDTVEWKRFINDPRELPPSLSQPAYAIWCTPQGWWVAQVQRNPNDSRGGFAMAALFLGANRPKDGGQLVQVLQKVSAQYIDNMNWDDDTLAKELTHAGALSLEPCPVRQFTLGQPSAYRTYSNDEERDDALTLIDQKDYQTYSRVFVLPQDADAHSSRMTDVTRSIPLHKGADGLAQPLKHSDSNKFSVVFELDGVLSMEAADRISKSSPAYTLLTNQFMIRPNGSQLHVNVPRPHATIDDTVSHDSGGWSWKKVAAMIAGVVFALFSLYVIVSLALNTVPWPFRLNADAVKEQVDDPMDDGSNDVMEEASMQELDAPSPEERNAIDHDVMYLLNVNAWQRDSLQSEHYLAMYDAIKSGDIDALRERNWFENVDSIRVNPHWRFVQRYISGIENSDNEIVKLLSESRDKRIGGDNVAIEYMASQLRAMARSAQKKQSKQAPNKPDAPSKTAAPAKDKSPL